MQIWTLKKFASFIFKTIQFCCIIHNRSKIQHLEFQTEIFSYPAVSEVSLLIEFWPVLVANNYLWWLSPKTSVVRPLYWEG